MLLIVEVRAGTVVGHKSPDIDEPADDKRQNAKQHQKHRQKRPLEKAFVAVGKNAQIASPPVLGQRGRHAAPVVLLLGRENLHTRLFQSCEHLGKARI